MYIMRCSQIKTHHYGGSSALAMFGACRAHAVFFDAVHSLCWEAGAQWGKVPSTPSRSLPPPDVLIRTRRKFGVHTLKCSSRTATACVSSAYSVSSTGKCGAFKRGTPTALAGCSSITRPSVALNSSNLRRSHADTFCARVPHSVQQGL